ARAGGARAAPGRGARAGAGGAGVRAAPAGGAGPQGAARGGAGGRARFGAGAEAGVDARGGVREPRARRDQPRPGRDPLRAPPRRAGRGGRARALVRGAATVPHGLMKLAPVLAELSTYPFARLDDAKRRAAAEGVELIDLGVGDPQDPTDEFIRRALADGVRETSSYPRAVGLPELREAVAGWLGRRFGVAVDADTEVIPTLGSKEAI